MISFNFTNCFSIIDGSGYGAPRIFYQRTLETIFLWCLEDLIVRILALSENRKSGRKYRLDFRRKYFPRKFEDYTEIILLFFFSKNIKQLMNSLTGGLSIFWKTVRLNQFFRYYLEHY